MNHMKTGKGERHMKAKKYSHMEIHSAENGGHIIKHHFDNSVGGEGYHEPEQHVFGSDEGDKAMDHIAEHAGIKMPSEAEGESTGEDTEA